MKQKDVAIRKRTQIAKTNRTMFLWVAAASVIVGFAAVTSIFLAQKLIFNERVLMEKDKTVSTLKANNAIVSELEAQVRALDTNTDLQSVKANPDDQALQVILDALPSDANSLALGASLQRNLLGIVPGLSIESMQVEPVAGIEALGDGAVEDASLAAESGDGSDTSSQTQIDFRFTVTGSQQALKEALTNIERSIRTIDITSLKIETQGGFQEMSVGGRAFYEPARTVELKDKVVKKQ